MGAGEQNPGLSDVSRRLQEAVQGKRWATDREACMYICGYVNVRELSHINEEQKFMKETTARIRRAQIHYRELNIHSEKYFYLDVFFSFADSSQSQH